MCYTMSDNCFEQLVGGHVCYQELEAIDFDDG